MNRLFTFKRMPVFTMTYGHVSVATRCVKRVPAATLDEALDRFRKVYKARYYKVYSASIGEQEVDVYERV